MIYLLLFVTIFIQTYSVDFTVYGTSNKLLTWNNTDGLQQKLLISLLSVQESTVLVQKTSLPFQYLVDQNNQIIESYKKAIVYEPSIKRLLTVEYTYMKDNQVITKNTSSFQQNLFINISSQYALKLYRSSIQAQDSPSSNINQTSINTNTLQKNNVLYLFDGEKLMEIDSKIYSNQPMCYMLSRMTTKLYKEQQCMTLSPSQLYQMEFGPIVSNFSKVNSLIVIPSNSTDLLAHRVIYGSLQTIINEIPSVQENKTIQQSESQNLKQQNLTNLNNTTQQNNYLQTSNSIKINQENITISKPNTIITVNFELTQTNTQNTGSLTTDSIQTPQYDVKIVFKNPQSSYVIKTLSLFKGTQQLLSDRITFKPYQQIDYKTTYKKESSETPYVLIYNEQLQLQGNYSMNINIDQQYVQQSQTIKSNQIIKQNSIIENVSVQQSHDNKLGIIVVASSLGGSFIIAIIILWLCRKRIFKKCYQNNQQQNKQIVKKNQQQVDRKQSGRQLNIPYQITFQKKNQCLSTNIPSTNSKDTLSKQNPQSQQNPHQCSIEADLPTFSNKGSIISQKAKQNDKTNQIQQNLPSNIQKPVSSQISLSIHSNYSKSYSRKQLNPKNIKKQIKQEEETQNI